MLRRTRILRVTLLLAMQVLAPGAIQLWAQDFRATIMGRVTDKTGAVIPNASVTAIKVDTDEPYSTKANEDGMYSLPLLLPGVYRVTVEAPGFSKTIRENVTLSVADKMEVNFALLV